MKNNILFAICVYLSASIANADSFKNVFFCGQSHKSVWVRVDFKNLEQHFYEINLYLDENSLYTYEQLNTNDQTKTIAIHATFTPKERKVTINYTLPRDEVYSREYIFNQETNHLKDQSNDNFDFIFSHCKR